MASPSAASTSSSSSFLDGRSFEQYVRLERVTPEEVARITIAVLDVLAAAHARGIVHRDIKPGNVLILRDGDLRSSTSASRAFDGRVMRT